MKWGNLSSRLVGSIELRVPGGAVRKTCPMEIAFISAGLWGLHSFVGMAPLFMTTTEAIQAQEMLMKL